jgi:succinylarginine dihydrolase
MKGYEVNFDGLVGPTHHYAGLSLVMKHRPKTAIICQSKIGSETRLIKNESFG